MDDHGIPGLVQQLLLDQIHVGDLGHLLLDVAVILDVDAALGDQGSNGFGVFGISLGHSQADIGPFHKAFSFLLVETLKNIYKIEELRKRILYTLGLLLVYVLEGFD